MQLNIKQFIDANQYYIKTVWRLFLASMAIGAITVFLYPQLMEQILASFADKFGDNPVLNNQLMLEIFLNNLYVSLAAWLAGIVLGLVPLFVVAINGFILGYVATYILAASENFNLSLAFLVQGLLPHGIFEIPAFLLAAVLGLKLGWEWLQQGSQGRRFSVLWSAFWVSSKYFLWVVVILFIAAFIEVFISGQLVNNF